jgi:DNA repair protein SbcD/Mre11
MRILHTADWHLGQLFHNFDRHHEHQCFLDWLVECIAIQKADVLLVSGDVFDTANPSSLAQSQLYRFLAQTKVKSPDLQIVITAGNHDSAGRLEAPIPLLEELKITVVGQVRRNEQGEIDYQHLIVPLKDNTNIIAAWCLAVPFLRPSDLPRCEVQTDPYIAGIAELYKQASKLAFERCEPSQAVIAMGHCHLNNGHTSKDSERRLIVGGVESLSMEIFDDRLSYVALGHLHLPQVIDDSGKIRYSGSPLPLTFSEIDYPHQILLVELDEGTVNKISPINVPRFVELLRIPRSPQPLQAVLAALEALDCPELPLKEQPYLEVCVKVEGPEPSLRIQIEAALKDKHVRLVKITPSYPDRESSDPSSPKLTFEDLDRLDPEDMFRKLYNKTYASEPPPELLTAFRNLLVNDRSEELQ